MSPVETFGIVSAIVGGVWVLRSKLSDIEAAVRGHIERDEELHAGLAARIVKLEEFRVRR